MKPGQYVNWGVVDGSFLPASTELLVRLPNTEETMTED